MTDILYSDILLAKSGKRFTKIRENENSDQEELSSMFDIYEKFEELDNSDNAIGVSPLAYVTLLCIR